MGEEASEAVTLKDDEGIDLEDVLVALCIDARSNPETFNAESLRSALEAAGLEDIWNDAGAANEDEDDEDDDDDDESDPSEDADEDGDDDGTGDDADVGEGDEG